LCEVAARLEVKCKCDRRLAQEFNAKTAGYKEGVPLRIKLRVYSDKSYEWDLLTPPSSWLIRKAAGAVHDARQPSHSALAFASGDSYSPAMHAIAQ
jgi:ribosomal protein L11